LVFFFLILFLLPYISFSKTLQIQTVKKKEIILYSSVPAFIISKNTITVSSKLMGYVTSLKVDVGDKVKKGETILKIDSESIKEKIKQAKANLENARFNYRKIKKLYRSGVVSRKTYIAAKSAYDLAQAALKDVETLMSYSVVRSPINGYVSKRFVQNGDLAAPSQPLLSIEGYGIYQVEANISNSLFDNILKMKNIPVIIGNKEIEGQLQYAQKSEDPISHTHLVKILIPKTNFTHPGEFALILVKIKTINAVVINRSAIITRGGVRGAFVVEKNGKAFFRILRLGQKTKMGYIVLSGLKAGEKVIENPPYYLENNTKIQ